MKSLREFESKYTFDVVDDIFVYNICSLIDYLELTDEDYFESGKLIMDFATVNNLSVYSAPRDSFNYYDATDKCKLEKTVGVIVEDLS